MERDSNLWKTVDTHRRSMNKIIFFFRNLHTKIVDLIDKAYLRRETQSALFVVDGRDNNFINSGSKIEQHVHLKRMDIFESFETSNKINTFEESYL